LRGMAKARHKGPGLFGEVALRAMSDAHYERLIDRCWDELKHVFDDPEIRDAEAKIMHAIAEAFTPNGKSKRRRKR